MHVLNASFDKGCRVPGAQRGAGGLGGRRGAPGGVHQLRDAGQGARRAGGRRRRQLALPVLPAGAAGDWTGVGPLHTRTYCVCCVPRIIPKTQQHASTLQPLVPGTGLLDGERLQGVTTFAQLLMEARVH